MGGEENINLQPYEILCSTISNNVSIHLSYLFRVQEEGDRATEREREI